MPAATPRRKPLLALLPLLAVAAMGASPDTRPGAVPFRPIPPIGGDAAARKALEAVAARYRSLTTYRLEGQASSEVGGAQGVNQSVSSMRFVVRRPGRMVSEVRTTEMTTRIVADGESLWTSVPQLGQYVAQSMGTLRAGADSEVIARQLDPAADYSRMLDGVTAVRARGRDTVRT